MTINPPPSKVRCAIYTRKSSEEGLDQDFNSLHAQREACEAYVRSQVGEGWQLLPQLYDDGGYSGGTIERPALQKLLTDIDRGAVDIVVVYKIDRLTRSLMDFAKIVDRFDAQGASFVSVTQSFNTTTSMGRLTLNVLLSFAQFEREVTGERIRDKLAASKKKGMWMGGNLPLGYDADGRTLKVNEPEAEQVRHIFRRYLALGSVHLLCRELEAEGFRSKRRLTQSGHQLGGAILRRGALFHLLTNRVYLGEIPHKQITYPGLHAAIVSSELFDGVQTLLADHRTERSHARNSAPALLVGRLFDQGGKPMSPAIAYGKGGRRYRYYVSGTCQTGRATESDNIRRLAAKEVEAAVTDCLRRWLNQPSGGGGSLFTPLKRVDLAVRGAVYTLEPPEEAKAALAAVSHYLGSGEEAWLSDCGRLVRISSDQPLKLRGGRAQQVLSARDRQPKRDAKLIGALQRAHATLREAHWSPIQSPASLVCAAAPPNAYQRRQARLAFLAPDIQEAILCGLQPRSLTLEALIQMDLPLSWIAQRRVLRLPWQSYI